MLRSRGRMLPRPRQSTWVPRPREAHGIGGGALGAKGRGIDKSRPEGATSAQQAQRGHSHGHQRVGQPAGLRCSSHPGPLQRPFLPQLRAPGRGSRTDQISDQARRGEQAHDSYRPPADRKGRSAVRQVADSGRHGTYCHFRVSPAKQGRWRPRFLAGCYHRDEQPAPVI